MKNLTKKGFQLTEVPTLGIVMVVIAVVLGVGGTILSQIKTTQTSGTYAYNITQRGETALDTLSTWQNTWAVIVAAAVVIGIIGAYLMFGKRG